MKCVYCLEDKPLPSFTKIEHVIPQSFCRFKNNLTLEKTVCDDCNQYFGDNIEIFMARDTFEGASRFEFGLKPSKEFKSIGKQSRMIVKIAEGELKGAYAYREYSKEQNKVVVKPVPQIGFLKNEPSDYKYYRLEQIPHKSYLDEKGFDLKHPEAIRVFGIDVNTTRQILSKKGIVFKYQSEGKLTENSKENLLCEVEGLIDITIFRTIAKIAFNYLAYWEGKDFLLNESFDPIRQFIRYGKQPIYPLAKVDNLPILGDEPSVGWKRLGHIVTLDWELDKTCIISKISLFNIARYRVLLAIDFEGEHRNIRRGHFFNTYNREIHTLEVRTIQDDKD